ncbi:CAP-Gly domain-containing protein [Lachancea thermotolerans]|uniref:KLTH0B05874p n=1 Tax=Lachancea thermotolerans (strain ATCC 56472 / CBS 6340 / NRRL Y-8284) TaxID=559295 RepID=C5DCU4_LACTC|nr:KLTH0B05874p [Lachancea thermotolerans CBS 6340]CAR21605.1 KLTH0B05874p [Lachancea thermotolerans CBS 6340]
MPQIQISSPLCSIVRELSPQWSWPQLCDKLSEITGVLPSDMQINVIFKDRTSLLINAPLTEQKPLSSLLSKNAVELQVNDSNASSLANELARDFTEGEQSSEQTYHLPEEDYQRRQDSVLQWKKDLQLGKFNPEYQARLQKDCEEQQSRAEELTINERCSVSTPNLPERRGWLRFVGSLTPLMDEPGIWCGVEFDEPVGKNDGSFKGRYFFGPVRPKYGAFVKPSTVKTSAKFSPLLDDIEFSDSEI